MAFRYYYTGSNNTDLTELQDTVDSINSTLNTVVTSYVNKNNPQITGNLSMSNLYIRNVASAISGGDAVNFNQLNTLLLANVSTLNSSITSNVSTINSNITSLQNQIIANTNSTNTALNTKLNTTGGTISNDLTVSGNLIVNGNSVTVNTTNLSVNDNLVEIAKSNGADSLSIGQFGRFSDGTTRYCGIFRNHVTKDWEFFSNLTTAPNGLTVNTADSSYRLANIRCDNITSNTITNLNNNIVSNVNTRVLKSGDTMTGSLSLQNNRLTCGSTSCQTYYSLGSQFAFQLSADANYTLLTNKLVLGSSLNTIYGDTEMNSTDFFRATNYRVPNGGVSVFGDGTNSFFTISNVGNSVSSLLPHTFVSQGLISGGIIDSYTLPTNGYINGVTRNTGALVITSANTDRIIRYLNHTGTLLNHQQIILRNNSGVDLYVDRRAIASDGDIECLPNTFLHNRGSLILHYDTTNNKWIVAGQNIHNILNRVTTIRWSGDTILSAKIRSALTYRFALNFTNATGTTVVNGVTFTNVNAMNFSSSAIDFAQNGTTLFYSGANQTSELTATESVKLNKFAHGFNFWDMSLKGLTPTRIYELLILVMVFDDTNRYWSLIDNMNTEYRTMLYNSNQLEFVEAGAISANEAGVIVSYPFRAKGTSYDFRLDIALNGHIYAMACIEYDNTFNPN